MALTFAIGAGTAVNFPAWAATTPELVAREDLVGAIALNGIGFNLARALGPALGGFVSDRSRAGGGLRAQRPVLPGAAWRHARRAALRRRRAGNARGHPAGLRLLFLCLGRLGAAAAGVRERLQLGPAALGLMLAVVGGGAVATGAIMPVVRARLARGPLAKSGT
jgi:hypothetical protein